jgi:hypothetical protein
MKIEKRKIAYVRPFHQRSIRLYQSMLNVKGHFVRRHGAPNSVPSISASLDNVLQHLIYVPNDVNQSDQIVLLSVFDPIRFGPQFQWQVI